MFLICHQIKKIIQTVFLNKLILLFHKDYLILSKVMAETYVVTYSK